MEEKRPWIERTLRRMRESDAELPPARLEDGGEVPYLGERLELRVRVEPAAARTSPGGVDVLEVSVPDGDRPRRRSSAGTGAGRATRSSRGSTPPRARAGTSYAALQIRGQRTRWASLLARAAR